MNDVNSLGSLITLCSGLTQLKVHQQCNVTHVEIIKQNNLLYNHFFNPKLAWGVFGRMEEVVTCNGTRPTTFVKSFSDRSTQKLMCLTGELGNLGVLELVNRSANKSRTNQQCLYIYIYILTRRSYGRIDVD